MKVLASSTILGSTVIFLSSLKTLKKDRLYLFNFDIVNFVWKTEEREAKSIVLLIFALWRCFNCRWVRVCGWGRKSYLGSTEIASFSSQDLSQSIKYDTFWHFLSTGCFYVLFLWAIAVSDFLPFEIYENLCPPVPSYHIYSQQPRR